MQPSAVAFFSDNLWFFEIFLGVAVLIAVNFLFTKIVKHIRHKTLSTSSGWKEKIDYIFITPVRILLWLLGITLVVEVLAKRFGFSFFDNYFNAFRSSGVVLCFTWIFLRWKMQYQLNLKDRHGKKIDSAFIHVINKLLTAIVCILSFLTILQIWGLNIAPLIAFGGIGAAAVGFAAKDVIANFFGGFMLYINRPFMQGDRIILPAHSVEGSVEEIGWYLTCVRDKEKRAVYLPNALFSSTYVINASRMTHRHIEEKIYIQHIDFSKMPAIIEKIRAAISTHSQVDTHLAIIVVFHAFTQNYIELHIEFHTLETRYEKHLALKQEIMQHIYQILIEEKIEMSAPAIHVSLDQRC